jgi:hypothetical protein
MVIPEDTNGKQNVERNFGLEGRWRAPSRIAAISGSIRTGTMSTGAVDS